MKQLVWHLPNVVSLMRVVAAPFVAFYAINQQPGMAFVWLIFGAFTDFVDGEVARCLNAQSEFGKRWVDPLSDFVFGLGVITGYVFQNEDWENRLGLAVGIVLITVVMKYLKEFSTPPVKRFAYGILPFIYCICVIGFFYYYADQALGERTMFWVHMGIVPAVAILSWIKKERFKDWIGAWFPDRQTYQR